MKKKHALTNDPKIRTVSELMADLEAEIQEIKAGTLNENKARLVARHRALQLKTVDQMLGAARLASKAGGFQALHELNRRLGLPQIEPPAKSIQ